MDRKSEELRFFEASGKPYETNAKEVAQSISADNAIRDLMLGWRVGPTVIDDGGPLYTPGLGGNRTYPNGLVTS